MGFLDAFFGRTKTRSTSNNTSAEESGALATSPVTLVVLFAAPVRFESEAQTSALRALHSSLRKATFEIGLTTDDAGAQLGVAAWGSHAVKVVVFNAPMPPAAVEECVAPSHYDQERKAQARAHQAHALLYYGGQERDVLEQYLALEAVAASLQENAVCVLNPNAHTSLPAPALQGDTRKIDFFEFLRAIPLLYLPCGFVKYNLPDGVFMRTHGAHVFGIPDLGSAVESHQQGSELFDTFNDVMNYMREKGPVLEAGHTMQVGENLHMKLRAPTPDDPFFDDEGALLIAEFISQDEVNSYIYP